MKPGGEPALRHERRLGAFGDLADGPGRRDVLGQVEVVRPGVAGDARDLRVEEERAGR